MIQPVKVLPEGLAYLNIGCGGNFFKEWNNLELYGGEDVVIHDIRRPLPYPDNSFDAVYHSHVLEHLNPEEAKSLLKEVHRVLKANGICRIVVPDLERICRDYLHWLTVCWEEPLEQNRQRYTWLTLELFDQMVRERSGGLMLEVLRRGDYDKQFVKERTGDEFLHFLNAPPEPAYEAVKGTVETKPALFQRLLAKVSWLQARLRLTSQVLPNEVDPRKTGEAHKWMYDRLSLRMLLKENGFVNFSVLTYDNSSIVYWEKYNLDKSVQGHFSRKPDSLFVECQKPM